MSLAPTTQTNFPTAVPDSAGIPKSVAEQMLIAPFNNLEAVASLMAEYDEIAAVIVEPLQRIVPPCVGYLEGLRDLCDKHGVFAHF